MRFGRSLRWIESVGNRLPHPFWLFCWMIGLVVLLSHVLAPYGARSILSSEGLVWFVLNMVTNFSQFAPLGVVLVMLMGVAIAESSGLIATLMRAVALGVPRAIIVPVLFAASASSTVGSDAGAVVMPPLAAAVFLQLGRSPIAGLLLGFAGTMAGYTANLFPTGTDVIAMTITNEASGGVPEIGVLANYWFKLAALVWLALLATVVNARWVEPRFPVAPPQPIAPLEREEKRGLVSAGIATAIGVGIWSFAVAGQPAVLKSSGMVTILFSLFLLGGVAYGRAAGSVKSASDVLRFMTEGMKRMGGYLVLIFAISQFIAIFRFAELDRLFAEEGASLLRALGFESLPVLFFVAFIACVSFANLFVGSASAKWALFAPIFVPMFMKLGYHPAFTQLLYRVGDSATDGISPLSPFFALLVGWIAEIDEEKAKVGTVLSHLLPYAVVTMAGWISLVVVWYLIGWPVGPDSPILLAR